jgi:hypothetical protein
MSPHREIVPGQEVFQARSEDPIGQTDRVDAVRSLGKSASPLLRITRPSNADVAGIESWTIGWPRNGR